MLGIAMFAAVVVSQTPDASASATERTVQAAEKAAQAAERTADAAERIADTIAPRIAPGPEAPPPAPPKWGGNAGLGLTFLTGNAEALTLTGSLALERKWVDWAFGLRLAGAWGLSNPSSTGEATTNTRRAAGTVRGDRTFGGGFASLFVLVGAEFDHMKNIESRTIGEVGTGMTFFNVKEGDFEKLFFRFDLAARAGYETRFQYFPTVSAIDPYAIAILAPRAAVAFRWAFSKHVRVSEELEVIPFLLAPDLGRLLINNTTKLNARLTESVSLSLNFLMNFDSSPPQPPASGLQRKQTDVALTVGVEAAF
jgi:hypothetical protein